MKNLEIVWKFSIEGNQMEIIVLISVVKKIKINKSKQIFFPENNVKIYYFNQLKDPKFYGVRKECWK